MWFNFLMTWLLTSMAGSMDVFNVFALNKLDPGQAKRVENGHAEFCPWAASPCPEAWARPQVINQK